MTDTNPISYGRLAKELGYGRELVTDQRSVLSWLTVNDRQEQEMNHIDETQWLTFLQTFNLHVDLMPGTIADAETARAIREAAALDPGAEQAPQEVREALDDLTAATMDKIYKEAVATLTASLGQSSGGMALASQATIEGIVDAFMGRISPKLRACAQAAYEMNRHR